MPQELAFRLALIGLVFTLAFFGAWSDASAQGFSVFSGRNHPELRWEIAETEHFRIIYPRHLAHLAGAAAPLAEASYGALAHNLGVSFDRKIRVYLSDEDEITNGFAVRVGNGHTNIWVHQNDLTTFSGPEKWLRMVIAHELAHIFHYRAIQSNAGWIQFLVANPLPRFWVEGVAQYLTEPWNAQRGDRALRTAVLDDRLSYGDGRSIWNGQLLYAVGNSQVRYLADQYGDSTVAQILAHREKRLFGLMQVHDFGSAFRDVVGKSYRSFYDDWRRHVNVYYNTLAGQMEPLDSLHAQPLRTPDQYVFDYRFSADTTTRAQVSVISARRPVRRLIVREPDGRMRRMAEGSIEPGVTWSPRGEIAYSRLTRGDRGSIVNDLFVVDSRSGRERRLTHGRRTSAPSYSPDGLQLAFAASTSGTANIFVMNVSDRSSRQLTWFEGDVQVDHVAWAPTGDRIAYSVFDSIGVRAIEILDLDSRTRTRITSGDSDDRRPIWSPAADRIAYTSLRDDVPNVFLYDVRTRAQERVTWLALGASATDWLPADSAHTSGRLVVTVNATKERDRVYVVDARRRVRSADHSVPPAYGSWTRVRPAATVPTIVPQDESLILRRRPYHSFSNITHAASFAIPYYAGPDAWGIAGFTAWVEPLGKHSIIALGNISVRETAERSLLLGTYINNQWHPTIALAGYNLPGATRLYGSNVLVERQAGGEVDVQWPLDWWVRPYSSMRLNLRLRALSIEPLNADDLGILPDLLSLPEAGELIEVSVGIARRRIRPWAENVVHPLDGRGVRAQISAALPILFSDREYLRADFAAFAVLGDRFLPQGQRIGLYARIQAQEGRSFAQDYLGFSRYDDVQLSVPGAERVLTGDAERVRGYRRYAVGDRVVFGSLEYRVPLTPSLKTNLLGLVSLGATTVTAFVDAGAVWVGEAVGDADGRIGGGFELKNSMRIASAYNLSHALGVGWPIAPRASTGMEVYYRIRSVIPF